MPPPPTAAEQQEQHDAYRASGKKLQEMIGKSGGRRETLPQMTFQRLGEMFYLTGLPQLGAIRHERESPHLRIKGVRENIHYHPIPPEKGEGNFCGPGHDLARE